MRTSHGARIFPAWVWVTLVVSVLVRALSPLDCALTRAARLMVDELRPGGRTLCDGRGLAGGHGQLPSHGGFGDRLIGGRALVVFIC